MFLHSLFALHQKLAHQINNTFSPSVRETSVFSKCFINFLQSSSLRYCCYIMHCMVLEEKGVYASSYHLIQEMSGSGILARSRSLIIRGFCMLISTHVKGLQCSVFFVCFWKWIPNPFWLEVS